MYLLSPISTSGSELSVNEQEEYTKVHEQIKWQDSQNALSASLVSRAVNQIGKRGGQCVKFVREFGQFRRSQVQGYARNTKVNSKEAQIGAAVVTKESRAGHVAVVIAMTDTQIQVVESNYRWNERISTRWIDKDYSKIKGYLIP